MLLGLLVVSSAVASAVVDAGAASLVTGLVSTALQNEPRLEVVSSADVRRQLEVEASRQALGCDVSASSCLAEVAGAMGARLVVSGQLGTLGEVVILTLNLFDSSAGAAVGRVSIKERSIEDVSNRVDGAVAQLVAPFLATAATGGKARVLVLDIEAPGASSTASSGVVDPAPAPSAPLSPLFLGGIGGIVAGVVVVAVGGALLYLANEADVKADNPAETAGNAKALYDERDLYGGLGFSGVGLGVAIAAAGIVGVAVAE